MTTQYGTEANMCVNCQKPIYRGKYTDNPLGAIEPDYNPGHDPITWRHANGYAVCAVGLRTHATPFGGVSLNLENLKPGSDGFEVIPGQPTEDFMPTPIEPFAYTSEDAPMPVTPGFDKSLIYYLSGPMKGYPERNWPAFQSACDILRRTGIQVVSPHEVDPEANAEYAASGSTVYPLTFLTNDIKAMLDSSQGMILLRGWPRSYGARTELNLALSLEWPIWYFDNYQLLNMNRG